MDPNHHGRKIVWLFVAVGALAIFTISIVALVSSRQPGNMGNSGNDQANTNNAPAQPVVTQVDSSKSPDYFPADLPTEAGAEVVKNYNTTTPDGRKLGTRVYVTKKSVDENYSAFQSYFQKAGWTVTAAPAIKGSTSKTMLATKSNMQVQVTIGDDPVAKAKTVAIIFTELAK